jgi:hypothetical protein
MSKLADINCDSMLCMTTLKPYKIRAFCICCDELLQREKCVFLFELGGQRIARDDSGAVGSLWNARAIARCRDARRVSAGSGQRLKSLKTCSTYCSKFFTDAHLSYE